MRAVCSSVSGLCCEKGCFSLGSFFSIFLLPPSLCITQHARPSGEQEKGVVIEQGLHCPRSELQSGIEGDWEDCTKDVD